MENERIRDRGSVIAFTKLRSLQPINLLQHKLFLLSDTVFTSVWFIEFKIEIETAFLKRLNWDLFGMLFTLYL